MLALISLAFFAVEIFVPFATPREELSLGYFGLLAVSVFCVVGVDTENDKSWLPFMIVSELLPLAQSIVWICLKPHYWPILLICGLLFCGFYFIVLAIAYNEKSRRLR